MTQAHLLNPLTLPLTQRRVIEASAGTGKTWTLAALYVRLVLGHRRTQALLPPQILVMTFTEAATAELRERIRARLREAALWFDHHASGQRLPEGFVADDFLENLRLEYSPEQWPQCSLQLSLAADWMDEAAIYTIHGWSKRKLSQYALNTHMLFELSHLEDAKPLQLELMQDYWRQWIYPLSSQELSIVLPWLGQSPDNALDDLLSLWKQEDKQPCVEPPPARTPQQIVQTHHDWTRQVETAAQRVRSLWPESLTQALETQKIAKTSESNKLIWLGELKQWLIDTPQCSTKRLHQLGFQSLQKKNWPGVDQWEIPLHALDEFVALQDTPPDGKTELFDHLSQTLRAQYERSKSQKAAFDFTDLLKQLYAALNHENGQSASAMALAQSIRDHYPVALVDEFQDTDPWQYGSLDRIYASDACQAQHAFIMIGDPKQAIYSFRGANLATYLHARSQACAMSDEALHTLTANFRSCAGLVNAVNFLFSQCEHPFGSHHQQTIEFIQVQAKSSAQALTHQGRTVPALNVIHLDNGEEYIRSSAYQKIMSQHFANLLAQQLNDQIATPSEMAVLVRNQKQARQIQQALTERGIANVYLSDSSSVYASTEAMSLWRLLSACLTPNHLPSVRSALASVSWCLTQQELEQLLTTDDAWQAQVEQFHHWQHIWLTHGVLPLLHQWLHTPFFNRTLAQRLLSQAQGERSLSNLLHLGELLQHAATRVQGPHAVLRHLEQSIIDPPRDVDSQKSRLETDDQCVQIITYHKSKGLQYPLVFIPFVGQFAYESVSKEETPEDEDEPSATDEDMRLLYVALTRAQRAMWIGIAETQKDISKGSANADPKRSAVSILLKRQERGDLLQKLKALPEACPDIALHTLAIDSPIHPIALTTTSHAEENQLARRNQRQSFASWWTASYSTLTKGLISQSSSDDQLDDALSDAQSDDEQIKETTHLQPHSVAWQSIPGGAHIGTLLHDLLEWQTHQNWPLSNASLTDASTHWHSFLNRQTQWLELDVDQTKLIEQWIKRLITEPLMLPRSNPTSSHSSLVLAELTPSQVQAEMAFHLPTHQVATPWLDQCISSFIMPNAPRPALQTRELNGMLTGFMDLVFEHQGRFWIMDYKSNKLSAYDDHSLAQAVLDKRYDVQYVLYTLALHRLLRSRLSDYDYDRHVGAAVYYFLRGVDEPNQGLHVMRPPLALIEQLDVAFAGEVLA